MPNPVITVIRNAVNVWLRPVQAMVGLQQAAVIRLVTHIVVIVSRRVIQQQHVTLRQDVRVRTDTMTRMTVIVTSVQMMRIVRVVTRLLPRHVQTTVIIR